MARKRYQVFLSSTYEDLKDERFAVMESLHLMKCFVAGMEYFPAIDKDQYEYIKKIIDDCDYYLLVLGGRYGTVPPGEDKSYTEKEYDYAVSQGKPVIALLHNNIDSLPSSKCETDETQKQRYANFRKKLKDGRMVDFWRDISELKAKALAAVFAAIEEFPDVPGWIRGDSAANEEILQEINTLRKENSKLKGSVQSYEIKCLEYLKKEIQIIYHIDTNIDTANIKCIDIFYMLAVKLSISFSMNSPETKEFIREQIVTRIRSIKNINMPSNESLDINSESISQLLIILISLNLIQRQDRGIILHGRDKEFNIDYVLTEFGKRVLSEYFLEDI